MRSSALNEISHALLECLWEKETPPIENPCGNTVRRCYCCRKWRSARVMKVKVLNKKTFFFCVKCHGELFPIKGA